MDIFTFAGVTLRPGDVVNVTTKKYADLPSLTVIRLDKNGNLETVAFPDVLPSEHSATFQEKDIADIRIITPAKIAVREETKGRFEYGERVMCTFRGERKQKKVTIIGAKCCFLFIKTDGGCICPCGVNHPKKITTIEAGA
ncbi:MAG: hypothetical protein HGA67_03030 [Candidatus Yonathbacteria bacterium]|nr:hypothetical protein [Candidatus Yonathbacteria bacterium]